MRKNILNKALGTPATKTDQASIDKVEAYIDGIIAKNTAELNDIAGQIEEQKKIVDETEAALNSLETLKDIAAYNNYVSRRAAATDAIRLLNAKKDQIEKQPMISTTDYNRSVAEVMAAFDVENDKTRGKLFELSNQMHEVANGLRAEQAHADRVLHKLQAIAYKYNDCTLFDPRSGKRAVTIIDTKRVDPGFTLDWGDRGINGQAYKNYASGKRDPRS